MPRRSYPTVDPVFAEIAKAIYGDVDAREVLAKFAPGSSDTHVDGPMTPEQAKKQKKIAQIGLGASSVATVAGLHALTATKGENAGRKAVAMGEEEAPKKIGRVVSGLMRVGVNPKRAAGAVGAGLLGLHAVELAGDGLGIHAQTKALKQAQAADPNKPKPVSKGFSLKPLNVLPNRVPSLRAKRVKLAPTTGSPRTQSGVFQPVGKAVVPVEQAWQITKVDADKRQVFGWASVSRINGEDVVDLQGDLVPIDEIEKSAYRYVIDSRKGGDMHRRVAKAADQPLHTADMIESFVVTPEKLEKMGLAPDALPHGWWVGYHVNDDTQWEMVKSGERAGFSIHGSGKRTPVSKAAHEKVHAAEALKDRAEQAAHPPAVKLHPVKSAAIAAMGYQPQTRRLSYEMRSRPGEPYVYKIKRAAAAEAMDAPSKGAHFATQVRGKAKRADRYSPADRARLFLKPQSKG